MPAYNAARYINGAIASVLAQSLDDFELLIIDDGSVDDTQKVVGQIRDARIRYIKKGANTGLIDTLNEGVAAASGRYIARMDADDICDPRRFELQLMKMEETGAQLCGSAVRTFGRRPYLTWAYPERNEDIQFRLLFCSSFAHPAVMGTREVFQSFPYEKEYVAAEDYRLWTKMAAAGVRMTNVKDVLLKYRRHDKQESAAKAEQQRRQTDKVAHEFREAVLDDVGKRLNTLLVKVQGECSESLLDDAFSLISDVGVSHAVAATEIAYVYKLLARKVGPMGMYVSNVYERHRKAAGGDSGKDWFLFVQALMRLEREGAIYQRLKRWVS